MGKYISKAITVGILCLGLIGMAQAGNSNPGASGVSETLMETIERNAETMSRTSPTQVPVGETQPKIDGQLEEEFWADAVVWELPWEIARNENRTAPDETYVLMKTSEDYLHIAFLNQDSDPDRIRGTLSDRDAWSMSNNDAVGFYLDTFDDGLNAYRVMVNAAGVQADATRIDRGAQGTEDDDSFDFVWDAEVSRFDEGYIVEMTVPLRDLQMPSVDGDTMQMGFKPIRIQPRDFTREYAPVEWNFDRGCFLCQLPRIEIDDPGDTPTPIQWIPYASGFMEADGGGTDLAAHSPESTGSIGLDVKHQTRNTVFDATILPDFSQVETDAFQMTSNVRRAPILPEQRPFFMERTDLFRFPISQTLYTRSIVDPAAGARWTGKDGPHNWAAISMYDQTSWFIDPGPQDSRMFVDEETGSWNNLFRYRYDFDRGLVGGFYSDRITEDGYNRLISFDSQVALTDNHTLVLQPLAAWNRYPDRFAEDYGVSTEQTFDYGYLVRMSGSSRTWDYRAETRRYGEELITGAGRLQETDVQRFTVRGGYNFWMDSDFFERIRPSFNSTTIYHLQGGDISDLIEDPELLSFWFSPSLTVDAINQTYFQLSGGFNRQLVESSIVDEEISREFDLYEVSGTIATDVTPDYRVSISGTYGDAVDFRLIEEMDQVELSLSNSLFLFNRQLDVSHDLDYMRLFHDDGIAQDAITQRLSSEFQITRQFAIRNILQYQDFRLEDPRYEEFDEPDRIQTLQNQLLFRYRLNHATAVYIGGFMEFGEEAPLRVGDPVQERSEWQMFAKISYLL